MTMSEARATGSGGPRRRSDDVEQLRRELAGRRSRLWDVHDPDDLAEWVYREPTVEPLEPLPAGAVWPDPAWASTCDEQRLKAYALIGMMARLTVPEAARTAGTHWLLTRTESRASHVLRLTVGQLEILGVWEAGDGVVWLRIAASPIEQAAANGLIDLDEWRRREIEEFDDTTKLFSHDRLSLDCPDVDTALWLLAQRPVVAAARLMSLRVAAGPFPHGGKYQPETVGRAWLAAESVTTRNPSARQGSGPRGSGAADPTERGNGFDRPYIGPAADGNLPDQRAFDVQTYRDGVAQHHLLCAQLIEYLGRTGLAAGAHLHGVPVDLAWRDSSGRQFIAEVKSCSEVNAVDQLRLGLGQVLEYRHRLLTQGIPATAVLLVPYINDPAWQDICAAAGVLLLTADDEEAWAERLR